MEIKVQHNIPVPPRATGGGRKSKYPWDKLDVVIEKEGKTFGDSFVFPKEVKKSTAQALSYRAGKMTGRKFIIRVLQEGIRCWRVS